MIGNNYDRTTLLEELTSLVDAAARPAHPWQLRQLYRPHPRADLMLIPSDRDWRSSEAALAAVRALADDPRVASLDASDRQVLVRLDEQLMTALARRLEDGVPIRRRVTDRRYAVYFFDPCTTKPLHVGHLRNLALGNALAAALEHGGGAVARRSTLADYGRSVAEAMAGVAHAGEPSSDDKPDHAVGRHYAAYVSAMAAKAARGDALDAPLKREVALHADEAEALLFSLRSGDPASTSLWQRIRDMVVRGQLETSARLGIAFDDLIYESDLLPTCEAIVRRGLDRGVFAIRPDGTTVYPTARDDYRELVLTRADGLPTQHLRCVAIWLATEGDLRDCVSLQLCGDEWGPHCACTEPLLEHLMRNLPSGPHPTRHLLHGMVTVQHAKVSSSDGTADTIDDLLAWLDDELDDRSIDPDASVRIALGYFLARPARAPLEFARERLFVPRESPGWQLTLARRYLGTYDDAVDGALTPDERFVVVQAEALQMHLHRTTDSYEPSDLMRALLHFARWCVTAPRGARVSRMATTVLERGEGWLGLERTPACAAVP